MTQESFDLPAPGQPGAAAIDIGRVIERMDGYMSRLDFAAAGRHLDYWLREAESLGDRRSALSLHNEWIGLARKSGQREAAAAHSEEALRLIDALELRQTVTEGTTCINAATAAYVFGDYDRSIRLFERAKACYRGSASVSPQQMGGLYNNMGLTLTALRRYDDALSSYRKALEWMERVPHSAAEQAETCLNMADTLESQRGMDAERDIFALLDRAEALLEAEASPEDGYYAYICSHCAPTFEHFGYFITANRLKEIASRYYERA